MAGCKSHQEALEKLSNLAEDSGYDDDYEDVKAYIIKLGQENAHMLIALKAFSEVYQQIRKIIGGE